MLHKLVHDDQVISEYWHGIGYVKLDQIIHGDLESKKMIYLNLLEKTTCQIQIKCITDNCLQMYKTSQPFTNTFTFNTNNYTSIKVIKNTCTDINILKIPSSLKLGLY
jgi:hypothetical protein